ncbi:Exopolysaccharide production protein exoY [Bradyrhizobium sp. ORS 375]|uniref:sugar transferase n=1 Tax=Bradyrhizobium sp. (strain ORS 375) TaxID=566679 RepID=UPI0002405988|nr:sugar transferase [Bradyrhizobium sp. ORS 375]CCD95830.1 Exopolysaccharide production protein exoY [Bradyrhizobium sp. ORS 375]
MGPDHTAVSAPHTSFVPALLDSTVGSNAEFPTGGDFKRLMDILIAVSALLILTPLLIMVAAFIRLSTGDSPIFGHERIGFRGRSFRCLKFKTMVSNGDEVLARHFAEFPEARAEWEAERKLRHDPRVTPLGRVLRSSSLDELPQLINVLAGSMSIVGPRPIVAAEIERYGEVFGSYRSCRPGITGLWQVSGRSNCAYEQRVALDHAYAREWSVMRDCWIICKTVVVVVRREGSC